MRKNKVESGRIQNLLVIVLTIITVVLVFSKTDYRLTPVHAMKEAEKYNYFQSQKVLKRLDIENGDSIVLTQKDRWVSLGYIEKRGLVWKYIDGVIGQDTKSHEYMLVMDKEVSLKDQDKAFISYGFIYDQKIAKITATNKDQEKSIDINGDKSFIFIFFQGGNKTIISAWDKNGQLLYQRGYY